MGQAEAERWISLKNSLQLGGRKEGWSGGWEDEDAGRYKLGGRGVWVHVKEHARDLCCFGIYSGPF